MRSSVTHAGGTSWPRTTRACEACSTAAGDGWSRPGDGFLATFDGPASRRISFTDRGTRELKGVPGELAALRGGGLNGPLLA